jgi:hypothetical protein
LSIYASLSFHDVKADQENRLCGQNHLCNKFLSLLASAFAM